MIAYAEATTCRRTFILDYFGQAAPSVCDNCDCCLKLSPPRIEISPNEETVSTIYDCVKSLNGKMGRSGFAKLLAGSKSKLIEQLNLSTSCFYGRLKEFTQEEIRGFIDHLVRSGRLIVTKGDLPLVYVAKTGPPPPPEIDQSQPVPRRVGLEILKLVKDWNARLPIPSIVDVLCGNKDSDVARRYSQKAFSSSFGSLSSPA